MFYRNWRSSKHQAAVIAIHGLGSHSGGFQNIANFIAPKGFSLYAMDLRGHGLSAGQRAFINQWAEYLEDLRCFLEMVRESEGKRPLFLIGHSMGGLIALDYVMHEPSGIDGVVAICPALNHRELQKVVDNTPENTPNAASVQYKPNFKVLTSDPVILADLEKDPLQHQMKTIGLARGMLGAIKRVINDAYTLNVPLLMMHGLKDRIVPPEMARIFFEKVMFEDKKWIGYPEMLHNPQDDIQRDQVFADLYTWLKKHSEN
ncbi:alpha/beta hydrolase [Bacillus sp. V3-13]|uniref:alpha/beta hydrolase n=1 Tax=Bacillus sp. V3-13 TaxID=2053728 RepID=UPI0015E0A496|nr:alpha/beta hydrolase [Bacillus sp. V3-13]